MRSRLLLLLAALLLVVTPARAQLVITEFLASNSLGLTDELGNQEDWIEIQNTTASAVSLSGWHLTDSSGNLRKWPFPAWTLNAGNRMIIFASNRDTRPNQTISGSDNAGTTASPRLATNFKISNNAGGYLALTKDDGLGGIAVISFFAGYPKQFTDVSYGLSSTTATLVASDAPAVALVPTVGNGGSTLANTWKGGSEPFDDSAWTSGTLAAGAAGSPAVIGSANLKLRLNSTTSGAIVTDTSGTSKTTANVSGSTAWLASDTDTTSSPLTRSGVMQFAAATPSQVTIAAHTDLDASTGTIMFWMKSAGMSSSGNEGAMLWDRRSPNSIGNVIVLKSNGQLFSQPAGSSSFSSTGTVNDNQWHHVTFVFNRAANGTDTFYIDGVASGSVTHGSAWSWPTSVQVELGRSHDGYWYKYNGLMDDVRFYNTAISAANIAQIVAGADENVAAADIGLNLASTLPGNSGAFVRIPFSVADASLYQTLRLTSRTADGFVAYLNGTQIDTLNSPGSPAYNSLATSVSQPGRTRNLDFAASSLVTGSNILALHALNTTTSDPGLLASASLSGVTLDPAGNYLLTATPGAANAAIRTSIGPIITNVTKNPDPRPLGNGASPPLVITAKVVPSLRPLAAANPVQLKYLVMFGAETSVNMADNGVAPDLVAGDSIYTAQIATGTLGAGQMLRWRVVATDNTAVAATNPAYLDSLDNEQYYGTVANDSSIESALPVIYWFTPSSTAGDNTTGTRNSFFYKAPGSLGVGVFYDNVAINLHGQSSSGFAKKSYDLDFNEDNRFEWSATGKKAKDINLLTNWGDKSKTHNQMAHEALAAVGSAHHWCHQVRVQQVTPSNAATPANHFWSIADMMEDGDDLFLERNGLDGNGALYKVYDNLSGTGGGEKKTRQYEDKTDLQNLINGLAVGNSLAARRQFAYDNLDLPQTISYFVGLALISSQDHGHKNYYIYRDSDGTREWAPLPWDVDLTWGRNWLDANGYFTDTMFTNNELDFYNSAQQNKGENRLYSLIVGHSDIARVPAPEFRDMVLRRLRTVMDSYFSAPGVLEDRFTTLADMMDPPSIGTSDADRDRTKWGTWGNDGGFTTGGDCLRYHLQNQLVGSYLSGRRAFLSTATLAGASVPSSQPANAGDLVTIETVDFLPATGVRDHEFFVVRNSNTYPVDISGWQITGAVTHTFKPGTVLPAGGGVTENQGDLYVAKNPYLFRQRATVPDDGLPGSGQYRYVQGPYQGQLGARGETLELRDATGTLLTTKSWAASPTLAQNSLRISEISYNAPGPTPAESAAILNVTGGDFEFIELTNTSASPLNVGGASFDKGLTFTFPANYTIAAGASVLVVANPVAFTLRYGNGFTIAGTYLGNLDNGGEEIDLVDAAGESVLDFAYDDAWFPSTDGPGKTLVVSDVNAPYTSWDLGAAFWRASIQTGGTPGSSVYNVAPVATADAASVDEDTLLTIAAPGVLANDTDAEAVALQAFLVDAPASGVLNLATDGSYTYQPAENFHGQITFTYQASDGIASSAVTTVTITVTPVNDAPAFAADPINLNATEDAAFTGQLDASDVDAGAVLTFAKLSGPSWLTVSTSGALSGTPANDEVGLNVFTVQVSDGTANVPATLNITVANTNDAPAFAANPINLNATEDAAFTGQLDASDVDVGAVLTFAKLSGPAWLTVSTSGALSGTPTNDEVGLNAFVVSVSDGTETIQAALNLTVANTNDAPAFAADPIVANATGGTPFTGQLSATDDDAGDILSFTKQTGPSWLAVSNTGALSGTPANADAGLNVFTVAVFDGTVTVTATLNITVTASGPSFAAFTGEHFSPAEQADPLVSGPAADPDGDGVSNLLEYAFAMDPRVPSVGNLPKSVVVPVSADTFVGLTYTRLKDATDLVFVPEFSSSPNSGFTASGSTQISMVDNLDGTETLTIRDNTPVTPASPRFVRLRVEQN